MYQIVSRNFSFFVKQLFTAVILVLIGRVQKNGSSGKLSDLWLPPDAGKCDINSTDNTVQRREGISTDFNKPSLSTW